MSLRHMIIALAALLAAGIPAQAGLDKLHRQAVEDGRVCMTSHRHFTSSGAWPSEAMARATATRRWESFTAAEYGRAWGSLTNAASVTWKCGESKGRRGLQFSCELSARPCR